MQRIQKLIVGTIVGASLGFQAVRAEEKSAPAAGGPEAAMMQAAQKYMTPGEDHRVLDPLVGRLNAKVTMWMKPGDKPQVSEGSQINSWTMNKHFLKGDYKGTFNGQPFVGTGYWGYDNVRQQYQSIWIDGMGTGMMYAPGTYDAAKKTITTTGTFGCPMTGEKDMGYRSELKIDGPDKHTYSTYSKGPDGQEFKGMEIVYTRAK